MYTVPTTHDIFVVHYWVNMRSLNRIQLANLQPYSNQSTNHKPWFWGDGALKNTFVLNSHIRRSVPGSVTKHPLNIFS